MEAPNWARDFPGQHACSGLALLAVALGRSAEIVRHMREGRGAHRHRWRVGIAALVLVETEADAVANRLGSAPSWTPATCIPYRPERRTAHPKIAGWQTAVVGPEGEEIHTDQHGRAKLAFHWNSGEGELPRSGWVRVLQSMTGPGFGAFVLPRIGQEMLVSYQGGDPERPMSSSQVAPAQISSRWASPSRCASQPEAERHGNEP